MSGGVGGSRRAIVVTRPDHCARASLRWERGHVPLMPLSRPGLSFRKPTYNCLEPGLARRATPFQGGRFDGAVPGVERLKTLPARHFVPGYDHAVPLGRNRLRAEALIKFD